MARIIKTSEQMIALRSIRDDLKNLDSINTILDGDVQDLSLIFVKEGRKRKLPVSRRNVRQFLGKLQKKNAAYIRSMADAYNIVLSCDDNLILLSAEGQAPDQGQAGLEGGGNEDPV